MEYKLLGGKISKLERATEVTGTVQTSAIDGRAHGHTSTSHAWSFRIDNRPVNLKLSEMGSLSEGDIVTVVGKDRDEGFWALGLRNETTGAIYISSPIATYMICGFCVLGGLLFFAWGITVMWIMWWAVALFFGLAAYKHAEARKMLRTAPSLTK